MDDNEDNYGEDFENISDHDLGFFIIFKVIKLRLLEMSLIMSLKILNRVKITKI